MKRKYWKSMDHMYTYTYGFKQHKKVHCTYNDLDGKCEKKEHEWIQILLLLQNGRVIKCLIQILKYEHHSLLPRLYVNNTPSFSIIPVYANAALI